MQEYCCVKIFTEHANLIRTIESEVESLKIYAFTLEFSRVTYVSPREGRFILAIS